MEQIIAYFKKAITDLLGMFGITVDGDFFANLEAMFNTMKNFEPESESGSIDM